MVLAMLQERKMYLKNNRLFIKISSLLVFCSLVSIILFTNNFISNNILLYSNQQILYILIAGIIVFSLIIIKSWLEPLNSITKKMESIFSKEYLPFPIFPKYNFMVLKNKMNEAAININTEKEKNPQISLSRSQFFANATHEFKTPIFSIKGYIETLQDGAITDNKVNKTFLDKMYKQAERLESLFNNLIEISKIESNEISIDKKPIKLNDIMIWIEDHYKDQANKKGLTLSIPNTNSLMINGDLERLKICFGNLIQNAINYSEKGGISILIKNISNHINIKIIDNGIGIPIEYQDRIFERFFRVDDSRSRSSGGSGLGLAIVKHILEAHDSSISIDSTPEQGTIIEFTLNKIDV